MATASCPAHTLPIVNSSLASLFLPSTRATGKPSAKAPMPRLPRSRSASPFCSGVPEARANSRASKASTQTESAVSAMATVCALLNDVQRIGSTRATWARTGGDASAYRCVCSRRRRRFGASPTGHGGCRPTRNFLFIAGKGYPLCTLQLCYNSAVWASSIVASQESSQFCIMYTAVLRGRYHYKLEIDIAVFFTHGSPT